MEISPFFMKVLTHGYLAVDLFFILSGFVIYLNYEAKIAKNFPRSVAPFYWNRLTRIYPLHFLMLLAYLIFAASFIIFSRSATTPASYDIKSFLQSLLLVQAWGYGSMSWNIPAWSISAEWFVYLLFPFLAIALAKYLTTIVRHLMLCAALLVAIFYVYSLTGTHSLGDDVIKMALPRTILEFLLGNIIASLYLHHVEFLKKAKYLFLLTFIVATVSYSIYDINDFILVPIIFFSLISFLCIDKSKMTDILSNQALVYIGEISYATYIVHYLIFDLLKAGWVDPTSQVNQIYVYISFLIVLILSSITHHLIEMPGQKYFREKFRTM
jgi:peptidoglycan/LPS O-acetylase OafA/YrhL